MTSVWQALIRLLGASALVMALVAMRIVSDGDRYPIADDERPRPRVSASPSQQTGGDGQDGRGPLDRNEGLRRYFCC